MAKGMDANMDNRGGRPLRLSRNGGAETMAMPQRDDPPTPSSFAEATEDKGLRRTGTIEAIKRLDALLEYAASPCRRRQSTVGFISETIDNEVLE